MNGEVIECASFWDYLDGELDERGTGAYRQHLASCAACRLNLEEYSLIAESLRWGAEEEPPEGLRRSLLAEFRRAHPAPGGGERVVPWSSLLQRPLRVPLWGAASALLGVLGLTYLVLSGPDARKGTGAPTAPREEYVAYQVYGSDGALKAEVRTTIRREGVR